MLRDLKASRDTLQSDGHIDLSRIRALEDG